MPILGIPYPVTPKQLHEKILFSILILLAVGSAVQNTFLCTAAGPLHPPF
jgi:hypothetical protein